MNEERKSTERKEMDQILAAVENAAVGNDYQYMDNLLYGIDVSSDADSFIVFILMATKPYKDKLQNRENVLREFKKAFFLKHPERCMGVFPYL